MSRKKKKATKEKDRAKEEILEEMLRWIKVTSISHVQQVLGSLPPEEKIAYHFSDGRNSREIAKIVGVTKATILNWWKKWNTKGIVEPLSVRRGTRYRHAFELSDFDIKVPSISKKKSKNKEGSRDRQ